MHYIKRHDNKWKSYFDQGQHDMKFYEIGFVAPTAIVIEASHQISGHVSQKHYKYNVERVSFSYTTPTRFTRVW